jgi:hypothetical protein
MIRQFVAGAKKLADHNPIVFGAWVMGIGAVTLPFWVMPIRTALGCNTNQYTKVMNK